MAIFEKGTTKAAEQATMANKTQNKTFPQQSLGYNGGGGGTPGDTSETPGAMLPPETKTNEILKPILIYDINWSKLIHVEVKPASLVGIQEPSSNISGPDTDFMGEVGEIDSPLWQDMNAIKPPKLSLIHI